MKKSFILLLSVMTALFGFGAYFVFAAQPGEGLTISPPINEPQISPGETKTYVIKVSNPTGTLVEASPEAMDFRAKAENGEPSFYASEEGSNKYALSKWISFSEPRIALAPGQVKEFLYRISVPTNAEPGGHYGAVFFTTQAPNLSEKSSQVSISTMLGSLVLVRVPGQITEKAFLEEFRSDRFIYFQTPAAFTTRVTNIGNVHFKPRGGIKITGWYGAPKDSIPVNDPPGNVLPDSTRKFTNSWKFSNIAFGYFNAKIDLVYGESEKTLTKEIGFWIIPIWLIILVIVLLVAIVLYIYWSKRNKRIKGVNEKRHQFPQHLAQF